MMSIFTKNNISSNEELLISDVAAITSTPLTPLAVLTPSASLPTWKREKQTRYLSQAIQLEEAVNPHIIRATMAMIGSFVLIFLVWAGFTPINEIARTSGEVIPHGFQRTVQHLEGGIIDAIHVEEGQVIQQGDTLITLEAGGLKEDLATLTTKQLATSMQLERIRAYLEGREPDFSAFSAIPPAMLQDYNALFASMKEARGGEAEILHQQIIEKRQIIAGLKGERATIQNNIALAQQVHNRRHTLAEKGYGSKIQVIEDKRRINDLKGAAQSLTNQISVTQAEITELNTRIRALISGQEDSLQEKIAALEAEKAAYDESIEKLTQRMSRLTIKAPEDGIIKGLAVNTIGAIVQPAQTLMEIVPTASPLEVQVHIDPQDIGHVNIGQDVQVKFSSYDFSRYGFVRGRLDHISATTFSSEDGTRHYRGRILLDKYYVGDNPKHRIMSGMTVMADIITGEKTILQYLLKPIHASLQTAFNER